MAASSVTGVGTGSVDGRNRGSDRMTLGVAHLVGPRLIAAGLVTTDGIGAASIIFPAPLANNFGHYSVMVTDPVGSPPTVIKNNNGNGKFASFDLEGASALSSVNWAVFSVGFAVDT